MVGDFNGNGLTDIALVSGGGLGFDPIAFAQTTEMADHQWRGADVHRVRPILWQVVTETSQQRSDIALVSEAGGFDPIAFAQVTGWRITGGADVHRVLANTSV